MTERQHFFLSASLSLPLSLSPPSPFHPLTSTSTFETNYLSSAVLSMSSCLGRLTVPSFISLPFLFRLVSGSGAGVAIWWVYVVWDVRLLQQMWPCPESNARMQQVTHTKLCISRLAGQPPPTKKSIEGLVNNVHVPSVYPRTWGQMDNTYGPLLISRWRGWGYCNYMRFYVHVCVWQLVYLCYKSFLLPNMSF